MRRAERRRLQKGWGYCVRPTCGKLRKLDDRGYCNSCAQKGIDEKDFVDEDLF